jgi:outer membrane protein assembly factor BamB
MHATPRLAFAISLFFLSSRAADWTEFRGPSGQGHATDAGVPIHWSASSNVVWKTNVPGSGWSSPVVEGGLVYLTTGVNENGKLSLRVIALDASTGKLRWDTEAFPPTETDEKPMHPKNSPASATPLVFRDLVYAHFGHHGMASLGTDGVIFWRNRDFKYNPTHGNGGSPIGYKHLVIFNADGGDAPGVVALNAVQSDLVWKYRRETPAKKKFSFCTPLLIEVAGHPQLVTPGSGAVCALNPSDGKEIWRVRYGEGYSVVPRPVSGHGLVFISSGYDKPELLAIRVDGQGDVTDTHVAWRATKGAPLTPSPLLVGDELYTLSDIGMLTCWDARTGAVHYQERVPGDYSASPILAEGRIYLVSEKGDCTVLQAGKTFAKLAVNPMGERTLASPAVYEGDLILRTAGHVYRIGK